MDPTNLLSHLVRFVVQPGNLLLILLIIGATTAWIRPRTSGRFWLTALAALLILLTGLPVDTWVGRPLENRFPVPDVLPERIDGILVLGGFVERDIAADRDILAIGNNAERIMVGAQLAMRHPQARLVISGSGENHSALMTWLSAMGLRADRMEFESHSQNTFENAQFTQRQIQPRAGENWVLITSARHMPRAMGVFRKIGWSVVPYPVDYRTKVPRVLEDWPDVAAKLASIGTLAKEWFGLLAYYALGRSDEVFPAPAD